MFTNNTFIVQFVEIFWTKATRGAPRSNERTALPRAFTIDCQLTPFVFQYYRLHEWEEFRPILMKVEMQDGIPKYKDILRIEQVQDGSINLGLMGTPYDGQPRRYPVPRAMTIMPGQCARLMINARHTSYSGQHYSESVYNVAYGTEISHDCFLINSPDRELDLRDDLF